MAGDIPDTTDLDELFPDLDDAEKDKDPSLSEQNDDATTVATQAGPFYPGGTSMGPMVIEADEDDVDQEGDPAGDTEEEPDDADLDRDQIVLPQI